MLLKLTDRYERSAMSLIKNFRARFMAVLTYNLNPPDWSKAPRDLLFNQLILLLIVFSLTTGEILKSGRLTPYGLLVELLLLTVAIRLLLLWRRAKSGAAK
jgi:hypothetical protein